MSSSTPTTPQRPTAPAIRPHAAQDSQSKDCAHCPHKGRYHEDKGLTLGGKCDPWYTGDRCNCPGFEPVEEEP